MLGDFRNRWLWIAECGAVVAAVVGTFLTPPPVFGLPAEHSALVKFGQFLATLVVGNLGLLAFRHGKRKQARRWSIASGMAFILSVLAVYINFTLTNSWTVEHAGRRVLVGPENGIKETVREYRKLYPDATSKMLIDAFGPESVDDLWTPDSINPRREGLLAVYFSSLLLVSISIVTLLQASRCMQPAVPRPRAAAGAEAGPGDAEGGAARKGDAAREGARKGDAIRSGD